ncbi:hypothetical protein [Brachybacterium sp. J153]|uniref:hypothetical protein n=1 Tax=Brachybacterium sp. J153 TaxID=3116488 RepID=UPI002E76ACA6|nr:hypothetical protein [Brachybacterium sp. J153]MEE1618986.1 hypothetical protein [Brachybacterium sp. J153]
MNPQDDPTAQDPQTAAGTGTPEAAPAETESPDVTDTTDASDTTETSTAVFVRRGRTPALGLWVAICLAVPAVGALLASPFLGLPDLPSVLNLILLAIMFVGVPLAAIAALIDAIRHRGPRTPRS